MALREDILGGLNETLEKDIEGFSSASGFIATTTIQQAIIALREKANALQKTLTEEENDLNECTGKNVRTNIQAL
jgi:hypothetical protein